MECCAGGVVVTVALKSVIGTRCTVAEDTRKKFTFDPPPKFHNSIIELQV
jgi:hypothetical protein